MCTEDSPSGLWRTLGKRVGCKPSGVRIPHPPPLAPEPIEVPGFLLLVVPPDLRPPRVLPAREPSAPRASLCASSRSPARPRRPRGGLQSGGAYRCEWPGLAADRGYRSLALRPEARPCPPDPPAPVTLVALVVLCALARPRRSRGGLQSGSAYRCERPGLAAARGHCCQALGGSLAGVNRAVIAVPHPGLVPRETRVKRRGRAERAPGLDPTCLDPEALDDLRSRERRKDLARHKELRTTQTRADAAPA